MHKVTIDDLKGDVHDFPLHILQEMCNEQVRQGNPFAPEVFQDYRLYIKVFGGFDWSPSVKGFDYWHDLLVRPKFSAANIVSGVG